MVNESQIRTATRADSDALIAMQALSLRKLAAPFYEPEVLEALIAQGTMDLELLDGRTYFVAESKGRILGSGGWTPHAPRYHGSLIEMEATEDKPHATLRSLFVHPDAARQGLASALMARIEADIVAAGYEMASLHATLSGIPFYRRQGWRSGLPAVLGLPGGKSLVGLSMTKRLVPEIKAAA